VVRLVVVWWRLSFKDAELLAMGAEAEQEGKKAGAKSDVTEVDNLWVGGEKDHEKTSEGNEK